VMFAVLAQPVLSSAVRPSVSAQRRRDGVGVALERGSFEAMFSQSPVASVSACLRAARGLDVPRWPRSLQKSYQAVGFTLKLGQLLAEPAILGRSESTSAPTQAAAKTQQT
jgi:hypothetical protein